jgi:hypothetical protein
MTTTALMRVLTLNLWREISLALFFKALTRFTDLLHIAGCGRRLPLQNAREWSLPKSESTVSSLA